MTNAGYSRTPLVRKLGIRGGDRVAVLRAPPHLEDLLSPLPEGVSLEAEPMSPRRGGAEGAGEYDVVIAFFPDAASLAGRFDEGRRLLTWDGGLWACWPKRSSKLARDLRESDVRARGLATGLVDNKVCAVNGDWSGLRFVYRREDRPERRISPR
jgi:hypothetical protein